MEYRVIKSNELQHHGILGQKWGKKNGPPYPLAASDHSAAEKKAGKSGWSSDAKEEYKKAKKAALTKLNKSTNDLKNNGKQNDIKTVTKIAAEYDKDLKIAKEEYKRSKTANKDAKVDQYNKMYDDWEKLQDQADEKWTSVQEKHKSLGKNTVERIFNASKNNEYSKMYDDWEKLQDQADEKWTSVQEAYIRTGKNKVSRIINNYKYK